jgi:hypothetical protein
VVNLAYQARVQLWSDGFYATPGLSWDRQTMQGHPFYYFAYGAAVSEVVVDTLTGESKRAARRHPARRGPQSLNPAIDIGQIEGAFIQGMGWLTSEELVWHPADGGAPLLTTHAPSTYKIPTANDCPAVFHTRCSTGPTADSIHRSKAVGEPPLLLPFSVFFAHPRRHLGRGGHRIDPPLMAPATPEAILRAVTRRCRRRRRLMRDAACHRLRLAGGRAGRRGGGGAARAGFGAARSRHPHAGGGRCGAGHHRRRPPGAAGHRQRARRCWPAAVHAAQQHSRSARRWASAAGAR